MDGPVFSCSGTTSKAPVFFANPMAEVPGGSAIQSKPQLAPRHATSLRLVAERDARGTAARQPTDAELVSALRADDPAAPAMLWARCSPAVGRLLAKALGPCLEIEDLTQEVFLRVFVRLPSLREPA